MKTEKFTADMIEYAKTIRRKVRLESLIYGLIGSIYATMFFFGALYPGYGIPTQSIVSEDEDPEKEKEKDAEEDITYECLLLETIKEWF